MLELVWADSGYHARQVDAAIAIVPALRLEIVNAGRNRRLTKDYENLVETLAAFVALACIQIAVRRLAR